MVENGARDRREERTERNHRRLKEGGRKCCGTALESAQDLGCNRGRRKQHGVGRPLHARALHEVRCNRARIDIGNADLSRAQLAPHDRGGGTDGRLRRRIGAEARDRKARNARADEIDLAARQREMFERVVRDGERRQDMRFELLGVACFALRADVAAGGETRGVHDHIDASESR